MKREERQGLSSLLTDSEIGSVRRDSVVLSSVACAPSAQPTIDTDAAIDAEIEATKALDRQLLIDSRNYAGEQVLRSWWLLLSTLAVLAAVLSVAAMADMLWLRLLGSLLSGLTLVRVFIVYHDYQHQALLKNSPLATAILTIYGYVMLTPPSVWKRSHDHHHRHNSKLFGASIGSFPIMTTDSYRVASARDRWEYHIARSPLIILLGYLTVFLFGMCLRPLLLDPRRHWDAPLSLLVHIGLIGGIAWACDWPTALLTVVLPTWVASTAGAYLFYIQHNFPSAKIRRSEEWSYTKAALKSSSYLELGPVMNWLTGNIGYHHVHHLNAKIPFYRLPEAMAGLEGLQSPGRTSLRLDDILACLRLKLWDTQLDRFVSFAEARQSR